jgi:hypothetical protein
MTETITERKLRQRVAHIQEKAGCRNTLVEENAVAALIEDAPAYGFRVSYHNSRGTMFVCAVARLRSVQKAKEELDGSGYYEFEEGNPFGLDMLLPLNRAAALDLMRAYQSCGIFRTSDELLKRTERVEFGMEDVA